MENKKEFLYPELTYKLIGLAYKVDDLIGCGHNELLYCDAYEELLKQDDIKYAREVYCPLIINNKVIRKQYFDFLIENKVVIEFKKDDYQYREACSQLFKYLKSSKFRLGLIIRFTKSGVKIKRIPNLYN